jgi:spermidine/putrescine-binding protein
MYFLQFLDQVKEEKNEERVIEIITGVFSTDVLDEETIKQQIKGLDELKEIGETEVYDAVIQDLQEDETYKEFL